MFLVRFFLLLQGLKKKTLKTDRELSVLRLKYLNDFLELIKFNKNLIFWAAFRDTSTLYGNGNQKKDKKKVCKLVTLFEGSVAFSNALLKLLS